MVVKQAITFKINFTIKIMYKLGDSEFTFFLSGGVSNPSFNKIQGPEYLENIEKSPGEILKFISCQDIFFKIRHPD